MDTTGKEFKPANPQAHRYNESLPISFQAKNGLFGFRDQFNQVVIDPVYEQVSGFYFMYSRVRYQGKNYLLDRYGRRFFPNNYDKLVVYYIRQVEVLQNGKWGLADTSGRLLLEPQLDEPFYFSKKGLATVKRDGKIGLIDTLGNWIVPAVWDDIDDDFNGTDSTYLVQLNSLWGMVDNRGSIVLPPEFDWFSSERRPGTLLLTKKQGKYALVNCNGQLLLPPEFDQIFMNYPEFGTYLKVLKNKYYGLVDSLGRFRLPLEYDYINPFVDGLVWVQKNELWGLWDIADSSFVIPLKYERLGKLSEGLIAVRFQGKWGYLDSSGQEVLAPQFSGAGDFSEGLAGVRGVSAIDPARASGWGYIDKTGNWIIPPKFVSGEVFQNGRASVWGDHHKYGYIDRLGAWVIAPQFVGAAPFYGDFATVWVFPDTLTHYLYGMVHRDGRILLLPEYDGVKAHGPGCANLVQYRKRRKHGLLDSNGRHLFPEGLDKIELGAFGFVVRQGERWSWLTRKGELIFPFNFENIRELEQAIIFWQEGKIGLLASDGRVLLQAQFSNLHPNTSYMPSSYNLTNQWGSFQINANGALNISEEGLYGARRRN